MRRSRILLFAAVTAAAVALSGCSATVTGSPAPTGASTNGGAVVWSKRKPISMGEDAPAAPSTSERISA